MGLAVARSPRGAVVLRAHSCLCQRHRTTPLGNRDGSTCPTKGSLKVGTKGLLLLLQELRAELSTLLSEPLQPNYSRKYFTGGAAAAVAAHLSPAEGAGGEAGAATGRGKGPKQRQQQQQQQPSESGVAEAAGDGLESGDGRSAEPAGHAPAGAAATVSGAVQLAQAMAASRAKAAADVKQKVAKVREQVLQVGEEASLMFSMHHLNYQQSSHQGIWRGA